MHLRTGILGFVVALSATVHSLAWAQALPDAPFQLVNTSDVQQTPRAGSDVLEIAPDRDPYNKRAWEFRFAAPLDATWKSVTLEIEFFDEGAGVIQPELLINDEFNGRWSRPARSVSFTRVNTQKFRTALFEFETRKLEWTNTKHSHLKVVGLQFLKSIRVHPSVDEATWKSLADSAPFNVTPMVQLGRPMQLTCTVGIPDVGNPPSIDLALENIREYGPVAKALGFTSIECFVRWDMIEPRPGEFNFSHYDRIVEAIKKQGLKWYPNLVITSAFATPTWYFESNEYEGMRCLEHDELNQVPAFWNQANKRHVERVLKAFGDHYGPTGMLEAVRLGPSGNFGEAQYPASAGSALGYQGKKMHGHIGWWAGGPSAKTSFQAFLQDRYQTIEALNLAWEEHHANFTEISPTLPETYRTRRARVDMTEWYTTSMTNWCEFWARTARAVMPSTPIYQSSGGWGFREAGTDFSAQAASMKSVNGGIRLTNETDSFEQNFYATRLAATSARLFDIDLGYEPAGYHSARGTIGRFFSTVTTNGDNLYTRHGVLFTDPYSVDNWLREFHVLDARANPVIDVAIYYPETMNQLEDGAFRHLYAWGFNPRAAEVRRRIDADFLDENLIRRGFLDRYRVLVFCWGNVIEADVQLKIDAFMRAGGIVIYPTYPRGTQETIDGDTTLFESWQRGDTGAGAFHRFQGDMEPIALYGDYVEQQIRAIAPTLNPLTQQALEVRHPSRVFISVLESQDLIALNYSDQPATIELPGVFTQTLEPYSTSVHPLP